jgi:hypothetical protein
LASADSSDTTRRIAKNTRVQVMPIFRFRYFCSAALLGREQSRPALGVSRQQRYHEEDCSHKE